MSRTTKIWLGIAVVLILIGGLLFVGVMSMLKWDFTKLSTTKYETNEYVISEDFSSIAVNTETANIVFVPTADAACSVTCYEQTNMKHTVSVKDGVLTVEVVDTRKWYEYVGINFTSPKLTVTLPAGEYTALTLHTDTGSVEIPKELSFGSMELSGHTGKMTNRASVVGNMKIQTTTGGIRVEGVSAGSLALSVSTGAIYVSDVAVSGEASINVSTGKTVLTRVTCGSLTSKGSTGDLHMEDVIATDRFSIERDTGDVRFTHCDAAEISVRTDTGNVKGSLRTPKVFDVHTDTGRKEYPNTATGGRCEIRTDTGNIQITLD